MHREGFLMILIFYGYEKIYLKLIRTTNKIERVFREIRRRSNNIGVFNNVKSREDNILQV